MFLSKFLNRDFERTNTKQFKLFESVVETDLIASSNSKTTRRKRYELNVFWLVDDSDFILMILFLFYIIF